MLVSFIIIICTLQNLILIHVLDVVKSYVCEKKSFTAVTFCKSFTETVNCYDRALCFLGAESDLPYRVLRITSFV